MKHRAIAIFKHVASYRKVYNASIYLYAGKQNSGIHTIASFTKFGMSFIKYFYPKRTTRQLKVRIKGMAVQTTSPW